jgi:integrase
VQAAAAKAGLDDPRLFGGHSLRAGFLTEAARQGASQWKMQEVSRHKSIEVLADYIRDPRKFEGHAGAGFL